MTHIYALKHAPNHILESGVGSQQPLDFAGKQMLAKLINPNKYPQNTSIVLNITRPQKLYVQLLDYYVVTLDQRRTIVSPNHLLKE